MKSVFYCLGVHFVACVSFTAVDAHAGETPTARSFSMIETSLGLEASSINQETSVISGFSMVEMDQEIKDRAYAGTQSASDPWATIQVQNNFATSATYFGQNITNDQIWLYLNADPGNLTYRSVSTNQTTSFTLGQWVQLSDVVDGEFNAAVGSANAVMYAVISNAQPASPPQPVPPCTQGCDTTDVAYSALEWDFHVTGYENADTQNIDQFSFTNRFTLQDSSGNTMGRSGFNGTSSSRTILQNILAVYGSGVCNYPGASFPANYPLSSPGCQLPTGCVVPPYSCDGLPQDYISAPAENYNRMSQQISVVTGITEVDSASPYRWIGSSKSSNSTLPGYFVNVLQGFGKSYEPYLTALFGNAQNTTGYYLDYSGNSGYSFMFKVTAGPSGIGHGIEIFNIRVNTNQPAAGTQAMVDKSAGTPLDGTISILANGEPLLNTSLNGCAIVNPYTDSSCTSAAHDANPALNNYGLWTDAVLTTGAATFGCQGEWGIGQVITSTIANVTSPENQSLLPTIAASISTALNYGILPPTGSSVWNPANGDPGTNYIFGNLDQQTCTSTMFQAGEGNADAWTQALWQYQDLSLLNPGDPTSTPPKPPVYCSPLYISTFGDRFANMSPGVSVPAQSTILWELGVILTAPICPADLNDDGQVNSADLSLLLLDWGSCPAPCPADLNDDGQVNSADLSLMLLDWGACPTS